MNHVLYSTRLKYCAFCYFICIFMQHINISVSTLLISSLNKILFLRMKNDLTRALLYVQWTWWLKQGTDCFQSQLHQKYVLQCKLWKRQIPFSDLLILPGCPSCSRRSMDKRHLGGYEAALVIASREHLHCIQYKTWGQDLLICEIPFTFVLMHLSKFCCFAFFFPNCLSVLA